MRPLTYFGLFAALAACSETVNVVAVGADGGDVPPAVSDDGGSTESTDPPRNPGTKPKDAGAKDAQADAADASPVVDPGDGTPSRIACTSTFGTGLDTGTHGRLDGTLVAIVPPSTNHQCNADSDHLHLQIEMNGARYDIAANIGGVLVAETDAAILDGAWSEGWHDDASLDYPTGLGLHATDFTSMDQDPLEAHLVNLLADVNHISVFSTKYSTGGAHLIHRNGNGRDGALVLHPLAGKPHYVLFHFPNQTF